MTNRIPRHLYEIQVFANLEKGCVPGLVVERPSFADYQGALYCAKHLIQVGNGIVSNVLPA